MWINPRVGKEMLQMELASDMNLMPGLCFFLFCVLFQVWNFDFWLVPTAGGANDEAHREEDSKQED